MHRVVFTDASGGMVWHDRQGTPGRPVTRNEQEAFVRAVLRAAQLVIAPATEERVEDDLVYQLGQLAGVHQVALSLVPNHLRLSRITVLIPADPAAPGRYVLDLPAIAAANPSADAASINLIVQIPDRPGQELRGRLEHAPDAELSIDPAAPPSWLS